MSGLATLGTPSISRSVSSRDLRNRPAARRSAMRACRGRGCEACLMPLAGTGQGKDHSDGGMLHEAA